MPSETAAKPKLTREQSLVLQIVTARARGKAHYANAGAKETELRTLCPVGHTVILPDGRRFVFVDNFAAKETAFKSVGFDRFTLTELRS